MWSGKNQAFWLSPKGIRESRLRNVCTAIWIAIICVMGFICLGLSAAHGSEMPSKIGNVVKIREGLFEGFEGTVEAIDRERRTAWVLIEIFGRTTPVEIDLQPSVPSTKEKPCCPKIVSTKTSPLGWM
jgi:hypothetical protein